VNEFKAELAISCVLEYSNTFDLIQDRIDAPHVVIPILYWATMHKKSSKIPFIANRSFRLMNSERIVRIVAGSFVLLSLALGVEASPVFVSKYFLFFTAFVGLNLFQSGFTRICPLNSILGKFGIKSGSC
jgi:hypothetical protein